MTKPCIYIPIDARAIGDLSSSRTLAVTIDEPCSTCNGAANVAYCAECAGKGAIVKTNELTIPALGPRPVGSWFRFEAAGPFNSSFGLADVAVIVVRQSETYEAVLPTTAELLDRGMTVYTKIPYSLVCDNCRGLSSFELPERALRFTGDIVVGRELACSLLENTGRHFGVWCDDCLASGSQPQVDLEIRVVVPPETAPGSTIRISGITGPRGLVLGDLEVRFDVAGEKLAPGTEAPRERRTTAKISKAIANASLEGVILKQDVEQRLLRSIAMFTAGDPAMPRGLLLTGPPGTGKTSIGRSLAKSAGCEFIAASLSDLKGAYLGHSALQVKALWDKARAANRAIIFVDECEGAFPRRGSEASDGMSTELVQTFLAAWDGIDSTDTVWVIGATNRPDIIDEAIVSRFGQTIEIGLPDAEIRRRILKLEFKNMRVTLPVTKKLVDDTVGLSGRDLSKLAQAVRQETYPDPPTHEALELVLDRLRKRTSTSVDASATWDNLVLAADVKNQLISIADMLQNSQKLIDAGFPPPATMLLEGPPGTGKTQIARTLANECKVNFLAKTMADIKAGYIGQSGGRVRELFEQARSNAPCILFLDELDAIAEDRSAEKNDGFQTEIIGQLLQELDGVKESAGNVFVIAATNRADDIDSAIRSRFFMRTIIPLPNSEQRKRIIEIQLNKLPCNFPIPDVALAVAAQLEGRSGRDLKNLVEQASRRAFARCFSAKDGRKIVVERVDIDEAVVAEQNERSTIVDPTATWSRLILDEATKRELQSVCVMLKSAEQLERRHIAVPSALLLEGPPGTGKTQIARTLANEGGLNFIGVTTSDLKAGYVGQSGQQIKRLFSDARKKSPCIIFIDEIDVVAGARGSSDALMTEMVGQLLQELDGVKHSASHLFVVGATNRADDLDAGILSRFPWRVHIGLPDATQRAQLLDVMIGSMPIDFDRTGVCRDLAEILNGASGRDLKNIIELAERRAMTRALSQGDAGDITLGSSDLREAITSAGFGK